MKALFLSLLIFGLSACSLMGGRDNTGLIASLKDKETKQLNKSTVNDALMEKAIQHYTQAIQINADIDILPEAKRRIADMQLDAVENYEELALAENYHVAILGYESILKNHLDYQMIDHVLYQLSRAYELDGQREKALSALDRLVREYPDSIYIVEGQFRRAETLFVNGDYSNASSAYQYVVNNGQEPSLNEHALFKLGWSQFKQNQYDKGLDSFVTLLDSKLTDAEGNKLSLDDVPETKMEMILDQLRAISLTLSYQDGVSTLNAYLNQKGRRHYESVIYANLGEYFVTKKRYTDAADTYQSFIEQNPDHQQSPLFQAKTIDVYDMGDFYTEHLQAKATLVDTYSPDKPYWNHHNIEDNTAVLELVKENNIHLAKHYHAVAQRSRKKSDYEESIVWYKDYLNSFPDESNVADTNFLMAEIMFENQQYYEAIIEYERTAYEYKEHKQSEEAAYAALLAYEKLDKINAGDSKTGFYNNIDWQRRQINSALLFASTYPEHTAAASSITNAVIEINEMGDIVLANTIATQIVENHRIPEEFQKKAWTILADNAFNRQDYLYAEGFYQSALAFDGHKSKDRRDLIEKLAAAIYKQGEKALTADDQEEAMHQFLRIRKVASTAEIVVTAEYDAATAALNIQDYATAITILERFRMANPKHELKNDITLKLAVAYMKVNDLGNAAIEYERIAQNDTNAGEMRREALLKAADLFKKINDNNRSMSLLARYIKRYPAPAEAATEAMQQLAESNQDKKNIKRHRYWLNKIIATNERTIDSTMRMQYLAAKSSLTLADYTFESYKSVKLTAPLKKNMLKKKKLMQAALSAYKKVGKYSIEETTTAATFRTADIYTDFGQALMISERPVELTELELEEYEFMLEDQAYPFEELAINLHEINIKRTSQGTYDEWVKKSYQQLAVLFPARYNKVEKGVDVVASIN